MEKHTLLALGDSQTDLRSSYGVMASDMWAKAACKMMNALGCSIQPRVFGISGDRTDQILARADIAFKYDTPHVAVIYGGVNDVGNLSQAQTQANTQALIKMLKYRVVGKGEGLKLPITVAVQGDLPANGKQGDRYIVMADTSATGGAAANFAGQKNTITGNYASSAQQTVWEFRNEQAGEAGWGRIATKDTEPFKEGVSKIVVISTNYLNFTPNGDNFNSQANTGTPFAGNVPIRAAALAAADAEKVVYCDLYRFQSLLINGGTFLGKQIVSETTQNSGSWHVALATNQHHNKYGHSTVARALVATIQNQRGWIDSFK